MDLDRYIRELQSSGSAGALQKLTESDAGVRLAGQLDAEKLEKAAKQGDMQTLSAMLKTVLSTPEGRSFAAQVQKAVKNGGR